MNLELKTIQRTSKLKDWQPYVKNNELNIVVHPFYSPYFELERPGFDVVTKEAEQRIKMALQTEDKEQKACNYFLAFQLINEFCSLTEIGRRQELTFLLLPKDYKTSRKVLKPEGRKLKSFGIKFKAKKVVSYINIEDYLRTLAEVTQNQPNFLIGQSEEWTSGRIRQKEIKKLRELIEQCDISKINISGGFINGCLDNAVESLDQYFRDVSTRVIAAESTLSCDSVTHFLQKSLVKNYIENIVSKMPPNFDKVLQEVENTKSIQACKKTLATMTDLNKEIMSLISLQCEDVGSYCPSVRVVEDRKCL